jgi:hypothetical protein
MSTLPVRDTALNTAMSASVNNPFFGLQSATSTNKTVSAAQVLAVYPQFPVYSAGAVTSGTASVVRYNLSNGASFFEGLNARISKRFSKGLMLSFSYMRSKAIDQNTWLNAQDPVPERRISPINRPNVIKMLMSYQLPVGRGRAFDLRNRWMNTAIGGWKISSTYTFQTGQPISWSNGDYVYYGGKLNMNPRDVDGTSFDTSRFDVLTANQFAYHLRTFSTMFPDVRQDGVNQMDASVLKDFAIGERRPTLTLKCDIFNLLNHPVFGAPNVTPTNSAFGTITSMANKSRALQLAARLVF